MLLFDARDPDGRPASGLGSPPLQVPLTTVEPALPPTQGVSVLDHFKAVNDTYGHLVGDRVLRAAAAAIRRVTREGDVLIRYGGEEFLVVVPGAGIEDARELAERVRRAVAATEVMDGERRISVTASVGASTYPEHDVSSALELVEVADTALYASKESGRDRVTMA